jgi:hypothetical protein
MVSIGFPTFGFLIASSTFIYPFIYFALIVMNRLFIYFQNPNNLNNPIIDQISYLINQTKIPF